MTTINFKKLQRGLRTTMNASQDEMTPPSDLTALPAALLEAFIPGYGFVSNTILDLMGFDISALVFGAFITFAVVQLGTYVWSRAYKLFEKHLMSYVYIDDGDDIYEHFLDWLGEHTISKNARGVRAVSKNTAKMSPEDEDHAAEEALDDLGIFNFGKWLAQLPPRYEPHSGKHYFWHKGRFFLLQRDRREGAASFSLYGRSSDEEFLKISCIGRSTEPVRALLHDVKIKTIEKDRSSTNIRRPAPKDGSRRGTPWDRVSSRPSRPMNTVSLDVEQKRTVINDVNEYLHPASPGWYSARGIPWRRGYLFHGPPGTGKSSLSFALAGLFGLDIYVISLLEPTMNEGDLNRLFMSLPRRCIVLLEDIDSAGLLRDEKSDKPEARGAQKRSDAADDDESGPKNKNQGVSLSGLLNAIDGVASHEGRVLIMTTNHPEKLDAALIRPGRVDLQVHFTLSTYEQAYQIFKRMYSDTFDIEDDEDDSMDYLGAKLKSELLNKATALKKASASSDGGFVLNLKATSASDDDVSAKELRGLARSFASQIPEYIFSPAEIQGFLLTRKKDPRKAVAEVDGWQKGLQEAKEKNKKVLDVQ